MVLNEDTLYMKVVAHDEIYNFIVSYFLFEIIKMLKK
jgi:hypothetical protein